MSDRMITKLSRCIHRGFGLIGLVASLISVQATAWVYPDGGATEQTILEKAAGFDLMIMTTQRARTVGQRFFGTQQDAIIAAATCSVVCIQEYRDDEQEKGDDPPVESAAPESAQGE